MKRRFFLSILALGFGFCLVCVSAVTAGAKSVAPASDEVETASAGAEMVVPQLLNEPVNTEVDYYLAYPGILPDQPLYMLKMVRDRVKLWLTRNPADKAGLMLLYADKRVGAALVLAQGGKSSLAVETAQKAEKYLQAAVGEAEKAGDEELLVVMGKAALKHEQVVEGVYDSVSEGSRDGAAQAVDTVKLVVADLNSKGVIEEKVEDAGEEMMPAPDEEMVAPEKMEPTEIGM